MIISKIQGKKKTTTEGLPQDSIIATSTALIGGTVLNVTYAIKNVHVAESWNIRTRKRWGNVAGAWGMWDEKDLARIQGDLIRIISLWDARHTF